MAYTALLSLAFLLNSASTPQLDWRDAGEVFREQVYEAIEQEFGSLRGRFVGRNPLVGDQIVGAMGLPRRTVRLADGNYLVSGCRPHSCDEKSAVVITPKGEMLGAAMINYRCVFDARTRDRRTNYADPETGYPCTDSARLTYFLKPSTDQPRLIGQFRDWAFGALSTDQGPIRRFEKVMLPR